MLVHLQPPLAPEAVLPVLRGVSPLLCAPYLEAALAAGVAPRKTYDTELGVMYLQLLLEEGPPGACMFLAENAENFMYVPYYIRNNSDVGEPVGGKPKSGAL